MEEIIIDTIIFFVSIISICFILECIYKLPIIICKFNNLIQLLILKHIKICCFIIVFCITFKLFSYYTTGG